MIIELNLDDFNGSQEKIECKGFLYKRNKKNYFITTHSFLPINYNLNDKFKVAINSNWNELLILKINNYEKKFTSKISTKLPNLGSIVSHKNIIATVREICFFNFGFLPNYPKSIYIKLKVEKTNNIFPGTPFFDDQSRLVGITSFIENEYIYILPSYYIEKTFKKKNKLEVPDVNNPILKINKNIVKNNMIYNPYIGHNIPVSTYMVLESNRDLEFELKGKYNKIIHKNPKIVEYKDNKIIPNKRKFVRKNNSYILNSSLLHYIRLIDIDSSKIIMKQLEEVKNVMNIKILVKDGKFTLKI